MFIYKETIVIREHLYTDMQEMGNGKLKSMGICFLFS